MLKVIVFNVTPVGKPRMTRRDKWSKRPAVIKYFSYKDILLTQARQQKFKIGEVLDVKFYLPITSSWSKKKQAEMINKPHQQKPDTDNLIKAFADALASDDAYIWDMRGRKYWGESTKVGRIEVILSE